MLTRAGWSLYDGTGTAGPTIRAAVDADAAPSTDRSRTGGTGAPALATNTRPAATAASQRRDQGTVPAPDVARDATTRSRSASQAAEGRLPGSCCRQLRINRRKAAGTRRGSIASGPDAARPVRHSCSTLPSAQMSAAGPAGSPASCSGAM